MANTSVRRVAEVFKQMPSGARGLVDAYLVGALASNVEEAVFNHCAELAIARVRQMHPDKWTADDAAEWPKSHATMLAEASVCIAGAPTVESSGQCDDPECVCHPGADRSTPDGGKVGAP